MKLIFVALCALLLTGCSDSAEEITPGVLIYRTGVSTTCETIRVRRNAFGDITAITCQQPDGWFRVHFSEVSSIKRLTGSPQPAAPALALQSSYDYMRAARDRAEAGFLEACAEAYHREPVHLRALPQACARHFATDLIARRAKELWP